MWIGWGRSWVGHQAGGEESKLVAGEEGPWRGKRPWPGEEWEVPAFAGVGRWGSAGCPGQKTRSERKPKADRDGQGQGSSRERAEGQCWWSKQTTEEQGNRALLHIQLECPLLVAQSMQWGTEEVDRKKIYNKKQRQVNHI